MRCPDCNKFVSYDEQEPEITDIDIDGDVVRGSVRVVLPCAECGTDLKECEMEFEIGIKQQPTAGEWEIDDSSAELSSRTVDKDRHGKQIKNARYMKTMYGASIKVTLKTEAVEEEFLELECEVEEAASAFEEV
jgi:hypothetical protein